MMVGRKFIAIIAGMVAVVAALAVAALFYVDWQGRGALPGAPEAPSASVGTPAPPQSAHKDTAGKDDAKPPVDATGALTPPAEPTSVPSFDVVVIEPTGEGVIAGRAAPGWQVSVQSGGVKVAEAKADVQGEWSVVLEKPLPKGDHALSLKITSPDGTRAVSSQESVRVAVGVDAPKASAPPADAVKPAEPPPQAAGTPPSSSSAPAPPQTDSAAAPPPSEAEGPRALARSEQAAPDAASEPAPAKPVLAFKTVDYQDTGADTGIVTLTGTANPGATIQIYYGDQPVAQARAAADGTWQVTIAKKLGNGEHSFRAERIDIAGAPSGRAKVAIERLEPKPKAPEVAAKDSSSPQVATAEPAPASSPQKESAQVYIIRRGDTLWAIAKRYLGSGLRYTSIFQDNRKVIRNPNLIHPQQELTVPPN
jgi:nucleoid-associated protein YgaU